MKTSRIYQQTLTYLFSKLPMYQRDGMAAFNPGLKIISKLLDFLGNPNLKFKSIHIAGTNGKGTSAHGIAAILQVAGYKTGLYTSPHLKNFSERIKINGVEVNSHFVIEFIQKCKPEIEKLKPSFFEITVAMAFEYFARAQVDIAVIETGLGGRLDSTNVLIPEICLITNIGYDHCHILGNTLNEIAHEKSGIIKKNTPVVIGEYQPEVFPVFLEHAHHKQAKLIFQQHPKGYDIPYYIQVNLNGILAVVHELRALGWHIHRDALQNGIENMHEITHFYGRYQTYLSLPPLIVDTAHNLDSLSLLVRQIKLKQSKKVHLVFGMVKDKTVRKMLALLPSTWHFYWVQPNIPRALSAKQLADIAGKMGLNGITCTYVSDGLEHAYQCAKSDEIILLTGSTYLIAEVNVPKKYQLDIPKDELKTMTPHP